LTFFQYAKHWEVEKELTGLIFLKVYERQINGALHVVMLVRIADRGTPDEGFFTAMRADENAELYIIALFTHY
jgi:hypothetical protein